MQLNRKTIVAALWIFLPLLAGAAIYLFLSPARRVFFGWLPEFPNVPVGNWVVYSLPDGLWAFSLVTALLLLRPGKFTATFVLLPALLTEILQGLHFFPGTFDWLDLLFITVFGFMAMLQRENLPQVRLRLQRIAAGGAIACYMLIAMATSEAPSEEMIYIENGTAGPVHIFESENRWLYLDSATYGVTPGTLSDSGWYYVFIASDYERGKNFRPGYVHKRKVPADSILAWWNSNRLGAYHGFTISDTSTHNPVSASEYDSLRNRSCTRVDFWLQPGKTLSLTIPVKDRRVHKADAPLYLFSYTDKKGRFIQRRLRGKQFYNYLDKNNRMILE